MTRPQVPHLLYADKFLALMQRYGSRVIHQEVDPCPYGHAGCDVCQAKGQYPGYHARPLPEEMFSVQLVHRPAEEGNLRELVPHVYRTSAAVAEGYQGGVLREFDEGVDFTLDGRQITWVNPPDYQSTYRLNYHARPEHDVHLIHVAGDFGGVQRKAETTRFARLGALEQGQLGMDIPVGMLQQIKIGDRIIPVDATMTFTETLQLRRHNPARHPFVTRVFRAFAIPFGESEVAVDVTFNALTGRFDIDAPDDLEDGTLITVVYEARPVYFTWLDAGEFRTALGQQQPRLVVLSQLDIAQGQR